MTYAATSSPYSIGWDVGGWNCDSNGKSRDAIVILNSTLTIIGKPWRGNLRECINTNGNDKRLAQGSVRKMRSGISQENRSPVTMAIDTPLGFSEELMALITRQSHCEPEETSGLNRYLFRYTERHLFQRGLETFIRRQCI